MKQYLDVYKLVAALVEKRDFGVRWVRLCILDDCPFSGSGLGDDHE